MPQHGGLVPGAHKRLTDQHRVDIRLPQSFHVLRGADAALRYKQHVFRSKPAQSGAVVHIY